MNKKHLVAFSARAYQVILSAALIFSISTVMTVQAQQSVVDNPMLSTSSVRYGPYTTSTNRPIQIQSITPLPASSPKEKTSRHSKKESATGVININSATETELVALPGIGPSKARAIAEYRQQQGGFKSVDDLRQVKGIGLATMEKLRAHVTL
jgi:comEA protein